MTTPFPVHGQGVFVFNHVDKAAACVFVLVNAEQTNGLRVEFTATGVAVCEAASLKPLVDPNNKSGLSGHAGAYYWFSLDSQNQRLYAGVGEARLETAIYSYKSPDTARSAIESNKLFLESLTGIYYGPELALIRVIKDPITRAIPLVVKHVDELTMDHIASAGAMPIANLPAICQKLYNCIAGKNFRLDTADFPDFPQAIEYSIKTPGMWCYNKLRDKSREFNPDKPNLLETYLRITLGENNGESPGIPYVMEIWPVGHYSPIHSHAGASAIIRVLNGEISVALYPFLCAEKDGVAPFGAVTFQKDEIAWITPTLNQTHQLRNLPTNTYTCVTIQCYMYGARDERHYDYFDYLDADGTIQQYEPDSDMDFLDFKQLIRNEWAARPGAPTTAAAAAADVVAVEARGASNCLKFWTSNNCF
jgi:hypothetical protein